MNKNNIVHLSDRIAPTFGDEELPVKKIEQKSMMEVVIPTQSFADFLYGRSQYDLYALETIRMYRSCMPFFDAINRRCESFASIPVKMYNTINEEYIDDSPLLNIINRPNPIQSRIGFLKELASYFDICGTVGLIITGWDKPVELYVANPAYLMPQMSGSMNIPVSYLYADGKVFERFYLDFDEVGGAYRYWNEEKTRQLWIIRDFNPLYQNTFMGMSKAAPLWLQIQQFIAADTNNLSVLKRGGRPSLVWSWKHTDPMTDDQFQRLKKEMTAYEGEVNAGRQVIADNIEPKYLNHTNNDMQFKENREKVREDIYCAYGIPLSLISSGTMTMNNLQVANQLFYEQSACQLADFILSELSRALLPMMTKDQNLQFTYSLFDIQPLKERAYQETLTIQKAGILTDDELRFNIGYEKIEGGDKVWKTNLMIPIVDGEPQLPDAGTQP